MSIPRALLALCLAAFLTTGTSLAQAPPNQMPGMPAPQGASHNGNGKCGQTPKGCHKNQPAKKPSGKCGQTPKGCHKNQPKSNGPKPPGV
jgi:uncharacterized low-complexity protein